MPTRWPMIPNPLFKPRLTMKNAYLEAERPAPRPAAPTFAQAFAARLFGVVLLALLATALIKCTA